MYKKKGTGHFYPKRAVITAFHYLHVSSTLEKYSKEKKMMTTRPNNVSRPIYLKLLNVMLKLIASFGIFALSLGLGTIAVSVSTLFSFVSDTPHSSNLVKLDSNTFAMQENEIKPVGTNDTSSNTTFTPIQPQNSDRAEDAQDMVVLVEDWDDEGDNKVNEIVTGNDQNDILSQQRKAKEHEISLLKEALPGNIMLPVEKTEEELDQQLESIIEQQELQALIDNQEATESDLQRYYKLQAKHFEDEIALIDYCNQIILENQPGDNTLYPFCMTVSEKSSEKRQANEASLEKLRQDML
jgi:hypothetical protein